MTWRPPGPALLFCPADRPDRFAKAAARADAVILDLEDAVPADNKDSARQAVAEALPGMDPKRTVVRVNPTDTPWGHADVETLRRVGGTTVMVPKANDPADLVGFEGLNLIVICETARGVQHAAELAQVPDCVGLMWGGEDLIASLGGRTSRGPDGGYHDVVRHARSEVLIAAGAAGKEAIDGVYIAIEDTDGVAREAEDAVAVGFSAKACIHPSHVAAIRAAFVPSERELSWAHGVLAAASSGPQAAVFVYEGRMIDGPLFRHAESIAAAGATSEGDRE